MIINMRSGGQNEAHGQSLHSRVLGFNDSRDLWSPISGLMSPSNLNAGVGANHDLDSVLDKMSGSTNL